MNEYPPQQPSWQLPPGQYPQYQQQPMYPPPVQPGYQPHMPPPQPPKKKRGVMWAIVGAILILVCACAGIGSMAKGGTTTTNTSTLVSTQAATTDASTTPAIVKNQHYKTGQAVKVGDTWQITLNSVQVSKGQDYSRPENGKVYLLAGVTMKNISSKEQAASSLLDWKLRDSDGEQYSETAVSFAPNAPGGSVESGGQIKGTLPYEVPAGKHAFTLAFKEIFSGDGQTIWDLSI